MHSHIPHEPLSLQQELQRYSVQENRDTVAHRGDTCEHKADAHKGPGLRLGLLGLHANVHELPCGVRLKALTLAGRQQPGEGVTCGQTYTGLSVVRSPCTVMHLWCVLHGGNVKQRCPSQ